METGSHRVVPTGHLTDIHVHAPPRAGGPWGWRLRTVLGVLGGQAGVAGHSGDPAMEYMEALNVRLGASRFVQRAVLLALDAVYDEQGRRAGHAAFTVPNNDIAAWCRRWPGLFLFGASVHPHRPDALQELTRCREMGAVLVKWVPNSQRIDPAARRHIPFYRKMAELGLPLLCHTGAEFVLSVGNQRLGALSRLRLALEQGVTVIAAHGGSSGLFWNRPALRQYARLLAAYPRLYGDTAALGLPNRMGALLWWRRHPEFQDRLLFGSDYPVPLWAPPWRPFLSRTRYAELAAERNPFDRMALLLQGLGLRSAPEAVAKVLAPERAIQGDNSSRAAR